MKYKKEVKRIRKQKKVLNKQLCADGIALLV